MNAPRPKSKPTMMTCSTCGRRFDRDESATPPFCSERCQLIDLGRWFNEEIGVPCEESADATDMDDY